MSANTSGDFRWDEYIGETVPKVLRGFRYFMRQLDQHYAELFLQPRADLPWIDVVNGIDFVLGPDDDAELPIGHRSVSSDCRDGDASIDCAAWAAIRRGVLCRRGEYGCGCRAAETTSALSVGE